MDPTLLNASPERIRAEVGQVLSSFGEGGSHVFNLVRDYSGINPEHVALWSMQSWSYRPLTTETLDRVVHIERGGL